MVHIFDRAKAECNGYSATYFLRMVQELGGVQAAKRLLGAEHAQYGLTKLWECGRLDISMEALVLNPRWESLFSDGERTIARQRLETFGYTPPAEA
jgi:hypothetical protein